MAPTKWENVNEIVRASATELAEMVRRRSLSPVEIVDECLRRIEELNPAVNAFVTVCADRAREAAREAERAVVANVALGPLHGVPIAVKDLDPVAGVRTTRGSRLYANKVPNRTVECVARLEAAGAIVVGKTNTPEFGEKAVTDNLLFGPTSTPFHLGMNSGGSSGGSAAAVASGMVPMAQGSDGGGSMRIPAAFCGAVTLVTSFGRVAVPARPNAFRRLNPMICFGVLTRTVEDNVVALDVMSGPHPGDPFSYPVEPLAPALSRQLAGMRVAYLPTLGGYPVEPEVEKIVRSSLWALSEAGAHVDEPDFELPMTHTEVSNLWRRYISVGNAESVEISRRNGSDMLSEFRDLVSPDFLTEALKGAERSAVDMRMDDVARTTLLDAFSELHLRYDLIVSPVNCVSGIENAGDRSTLGPTQVAGEPVDPRTGWSMTYPFNLIGHPSAAVPVGSASNGVPVGMQVAAPRFRDDLVVAAAAAVERHLPWRDQYASIGANGRRAEEGVDG